MTALNVAILPPPDVRDLAVALSAALPAKESKGLRLDVDTCRPHITLGHAVQPPKVEPFDFEATTVAACHLGRFCTCRDVLRTWSLGA